MICGYCGKRGHDTNSCWKRQEALKNAKALVAMLEATKTEEEEQDYDDEQEDAVLMACELESTVTN